MALEGEFAQIFKDVAAQEAAASVAAAAVESPAAAVETPAAPVEAAPVAAVEPAAEAPVAAATETPAQPAAEAPKTEPAPKGEAPHVRLSEYNKAFRRAEKAEGRAEQAEAALVQMQQRLAALEANAAQKMADANPQAAAAAAQTASTGTEWLDNMIKQGVEIPEELAQGIRAQQQQIAQLTQAVHQTAQVAREQQMRQAQADFDRGFTLLQERCVGVPAETLMDLIARGVPSAAIVQMYDMRQNAVPPPVTPAPAAAAPAAASTAPKPTPVPQLDAPTTPSRPVSAAPTDMPSYIDWFRQQTTTQH